MINNYRFASAYKEKFYYDIDIATARRLFRTYNIYFCYYTPKLPYQIQTVSYYHLYLDKDFDEQLEHIKTLGFPFDVKYFFVTDYRQDDELLIYKVQEIIKNLESKGLSATYTNISRFIRISADKLKEIIKALREPHQVSLPNI